MGGLQSIRRQFPAVAVCDSRESADLSSHEASTPKPDCLGTMSDMSGSSDERIPSSDRELRLESTEYVKLEIRHLNGGDSDDEH